MWSAHGLSLFRFLVSAIGDTASKSNTDFWDVEEGGCGLIDLDEFQGHM